jgi:tetratricopeptide (TPR) repeat protein
LVRPCLGDITFANVLADSAVDHRVGQRQGLLESLITDGHKKSLAIYHEYRESTVQRTGRWLLDDPQLQAWLQNQYPLIRINGGPGTGKSYLSSILVNHVKCDLDGSNPVAYFYVKEHDQDLQDLGDILKSLAYQLAQGDADFEKHTVAMLNDPEAMVTPRKLFQNLFVNFYHDHSPSSTALLILDGLDEAPKKTLKDFFSLLEDPVFSLDHSPLRVAIFSRPEVSEYFGSKFAKSARHIEIGNSNEGDIALYVKEHVTSILVITQTMRLKSKKAAARLCRDVRDRIMQRADGMFFKVVLIMDQIYDKERISAVYDAIEASPPKLEAMIAQVFERLIANDSVDKEDLCELLTWVACAYRGLSISELYAIIKERRGKAYDALETRLRGRFATLFKLTGHDATEPAPQHAADIVPDLDDFDIDDEAYDSDDNRLAASAEGLRISDFAQGDVKDDVLSEETVERFCKTRVRFSHASIRDFLVRVPSPDCPSRSENLGISVDPRTADAHIAIACMKHIINGNQRGTEDPCNFLRYSGFYLIDHLNAIDMSVLSDEASRDLARHLCNLFFKPENLDRLIEVLSWNSNKSLHQFFEYDTFPKLVQSKVLPQAKEEDMSKEEWAWIQASIQSHTEFLRPLAMHAARRWLTKDGHDDVDYIRRRFTLFVLWVASCFKLRETCDPLGLGYINIHMGALAAGQCPPFSRWPGGLTPESVIDFNPTLERTSHWYTAVGQLWQDFGSYNCAIYHFEKAIALDSMAWKARHCLALCYSVLDDFEVASEAITDAMEIVPERLISAVSELRNDVITINILRLGDGFEVAASMADALYEIGGVDINILPPYVRALYGMRDYGRIQHLMEDFKSPGNAWNGGRVGDAESFVLLRGAWNEIGRALRTTNSMSLVEPWISPYLDTETSQIALRSAPWVAMWVAEFMYMFYDNIDDCRKMCEFILDPKFKEAIRADYQWAYGYASEASYTMISDIYYEKAVSEQKAGRDPTEWVERLRKLTGAGSECIPDSFDTSWPTYTLAVYLRLHGQAQESDWKALLRHEIVADLEELAQLENDHATHPVFASLGKVLLLAGDVRNAAAAIAIRMTWGAPSAPTDNGKQIKTRDLAYVCDGLCSTDHFTYNNAYRELYWCTECYDTCFCEACIELVRSGKLPFRKCGKDHEFVRMFPVSEEVECLLGVVDEETLEVVVNRDWIASLLEAWSRDDGEESRCLDPDPGPHDRHALRSPLD